MSYKILIVDDAPDIVELLQYNLEKEQYEVGIATDGKEAVAQAEKFQPDLILLDIMMPELDGVEACRQIRSLPNLEDVHIIFLTARAEEYSEVAAFDVGADDYINKPIKPRALLSRIASALRKGQKRQKKDHLLRVGDLVIDRPGYAVTQNGEQVGLPKKEFELLFFLASHPDKVFTRDELLQKIWGQDVYVLARTVDVHIRKVREKIGADYIQTVKGVGYKFRIPASSEAADSTLEKSVDNGA